MKTENGESADRRQVLGSGLAVFERQVLVFPLLVVFLACASFLFGGHCAAWQWWAAVGAVVGGPFWKKGKWKAALGAAGLFAGLLVVIKGALPPLFWDNVECLDMQAYHLPMSQLLAEGWNPVRDPLAEGICAGLGLDLWGMAPLHVAFLPKTIAIFAAETYLFTGDPTALTIPGLAFLWLGVGLEMLRMFTGWTRWVALATLCFVLPMVAWQMPVDLALACAACGLLLTMQDALEKRECDWVSLTAWAVWMMNLKYNGVLGAFVFCAFFALAKCWRERANFWKWVGRFFLFSGLLVCLWGVISWNPLLTSWKTYGHPFYPFKTVDAEKHPIRDLTWDWQGNADAQRMGKLGSFVHAYVSPSLAENHYRKKWQGEDADHEFAPHCLWWDGREFPGKLVRLALWGVFALLLVFPGGRLWGAGGLLLAMLVPDYLVGETRYQPWFSALGCLAMIISVEWAEGRLGPRFSQKMWRGKLVWLIAVAVAAGSWGLQRARAIECKSCETALPRARMRPKFLGGPPIGYYEQSKDCRHFTARYNYLTCMENRLELLRRQLGWEKSRVLPAVGMTRYEGVAFEWDERNWPGGGGVERQGDNQEEGIIPWKEFNVWDGMSDNRDVEAWMMTPFGYWVPLGDHTEHVIEYYTMAEPREGETQAGRMRRRVGYAARAWAVTYPKEVWKWLTGRAIRRERADTDHSACRRWERA